jgi:hypothetical protein
VWQGVPWKVGIMKRVHIDNKVGTFVIMQNNLTCSVRGLPLLLHLLIDQFALISKLAIMLSIEDE